MKQIFFILIVAIAFACTATPKEKPMKQLVVEALNFSLQQYLRMAEKLASQDGVLPRSFVDGKFTSSDSRWWCSGFFPGSLWIVLIFDFTE